MNIHNVSAAATREAMLFSTASRTAALLPPFNRWLVGNSAVPKGWMRSLQHTDEIGSVPTRHEAPGKWVSFAGDPEGPWIPRPKLYKWAGVLAVAATDISKLREVYPDAQEAVAVALQSAAVVVGVLAEDKQFALDPDNPNERLLVAGRIGRGTLQMAAGFWLPYDRQFIAFPSEPIGRMPIDETLSGIPIA